VLQSRYLGVDSDDPLLGGRDDDRAAGDRSSFVLKASLSAAIAAIREKINRASVL
jgi:hypothetical protein